MTRHFGTLQYAAYGLEAQEEVYVELPDGVSLDDLVGEGGPIGWGGLRLESIVARGGRVTDTEGRELHAE